MREKNPMVKIKKKRIITHACIRSLAYRFGMNKKNRKNKIMGKKVCLKVKGF